MKKIIAALFITVTAGLASAQTISFDKTTWDYGTVKTGADGQRLFTIKNTGDKPLILSNVSASCGCTTPEWSKEPIMPGKSAQIKVGYNTKINGKFTKQIEVFSNDPNASRSVLTITGTVDPNAVEKILTPAEKKKLEIDKKKEEITKTEAGIATAKTGGDKAQVKTLKKDLKTKTTELEALNKELQTL